MEWSPQQDAALVAMRRWLRSGDRLFYLSGYAGTGKTTLIKEIAQDIKGGHSFCAYTGKAASVLRRKGCRGATTIHRLIYTPQEEVRQAVKNLRAQHDEICGWVKEFDAGGVDDGIFYANAILKPDIAIKGARLEELRRQLESPRWILREALAGDPPPSVIILDECSMVNEQLAQDLMSFGTKLLIVGDPFQLPPIHGAGFFSTNSPDVMLTEVHRQALESPPLRMATLVRQGEMLPFGEFHVPMWRLNEEQLQGMMTGADQIIVGLHRNRHRVNAAMRKLKDFAGPMPLPGERLLCFRNNHQLGLLNGTMWQVLDCDGTSCGRFYRVTLKALDDPEMAAEQPVEANIHREPFEGGRIWPEDKFDANEFEYGYGITCHKSQGSEWDNVLIVDDWRGDSHAQWLYTALTRAAKNVMVVKEGRGGFRPAVIEGAESEVR